MHLDADVPPSVGRARTAHINVLRTQREVKWTRLGPNRDPTLEKAQYATVRTPNHFRTMPKLVCLDMFARCRSEDGTMLPKSGTGCMVHRVHTWTTMLQRKEQRAY